MMCILPLNPVMTSWKKLGFMKSWESFKKEIKMVTIWNCPPGLILKLKGYRLQNEIKKILGTSMTISPFYWLTRNRFQFHFQKICPFEQKIQFKKRRLFMILLRIFCMRYFLKHRMRYFSYIKNGKFWFQAPGFKLKLL